MTTWCSTQTLTREGVASGLPRIPINLAYLPRATSGGELILEVIPNSGGSILILSGMVPPDIQESQCVFSPPMSQVQDKKPVQPTHEMELKSLGYRNPEYNPYDSDPDFNPWDSSGIWWATPTQKKRSPA